MNKGIKLRMYPNKEQEELINKTFGCCRLVYNAGLNLRIVAYKNGCKAGYRETSAMLTCLKKREHFLKEVDSIALQQALRDLDIAYKNFFSKENGFPKFKSKKNNFQSYRTINQGQIRIEGNKLKLPKLGYVKVKKSMDIDNINNVTIERVPSGKYFAVLNVDSEPVKLFITNKSIGIDVGIKEFYSDSDGNIVSNPKYLEKAERKLKREQRKLSRKVKGSNNRNKQRIKVALCHEKVTNQRNDFLHKTSTKLINENQVICVENLNVKGMIRNHKLAKHISSVSWSNFFRMLNYKAEWYGRTVIKVPTLYPSSQTCSCCECINREVKNLSVRKWQCPNCGAVHDRDINAAINILNKGISA